jgi:iron complex outermembrane recepter protein
MTLTKVAYSKEFFQQAIFPKRLLHNFFSHKSTKFLFGTILGQTTVFNSNLLLMLNLFIGWENMNRETNSTLKRQISAFLGKTFIISFLLFIGVNTTWANPPNDLSLHAEDLTQLSLEDLMNIEITSVSKKSQKLSDAAAAIFVITQEDIRRSGVTSIPEALRMVPGLQVAKIDANKWAIAARGFNGRFANKLLVLMDGRSVYTPTYSGVFWENIDTVLEDIDRIEVIRGPGASLWGANAVNGVINIITKPAAQTQGIMASGITGSEESGTVSLRYGARLGDKTPFRFYFKGFEREEAVDAAGDDTADDWRYVRGGFRLEHQPNSRDTFTLQGDIFDGTNGETVSVGSLAPPYSATFNNDHEEKGYNLLARWTRTFSDASEISLQAYYDRNEHRLHLTKAEVDTFDFEFQHRFPIGKRHDFTWGLGYRLYQDSLDPEPALMTIDPSSRDFDIFSAFLQDDINFFDKQFRIIIGSKFEYNDFTHFEIQPTARVLWKPNEKHSLWVSVSRAVRTPSRGERDSTALLSVIPPPAMGPLPVAVTYVGSEDFDSETLMAYELGYRVEATSKLSLDATLYYNDYKDLRQNTFGAPVPAIPPTYLILPVTSTNDTEAEVYGFELAADWRPTKWGRIQAAYTYMDMDIDSGADNVESDQNPNYQLSLRTAFDLPWNLELDLWYRYIDNLGDVIESYSTLDARLGWKYGDHLELSLVGQNLLDSHHPEFEPEALNTVATEVERSVYGKITWRFD